ncbi:hypothetical protein GALMADRAFT_238820 [Galerina marginata CBS 339.88]|uniref:Radical SAM core domain-containing protein n=1 Tax=Galerina marginata (strain CBS 339.88) TaxID=685588 RepID=A0A067TIT3_GALM3|nr:hypothetical protein GALMADRAFT_238820 [Galerina marginata CBS 339.88]
MAIVDPTRNLIIQLPADYFPNRECNYACEFCFHPALSSHIETPDKAKHGLRLVAEAGMKINMSGGEPFLTSKFIEAESSSSAKPTLNLNRLG